jgi:3-mercaptopyruvate sulfurtransferase SseA
MMLKRCLISLSIIFLALASGAVANPADYPEFARQKVTDDIPIRFITAESVKQRIDSGSTQLIIDVRNQSSYQKKHLPGARSIPLRTLPDRVAEVPRDIPVVLY